MEGGRRMCITPAFSLHWSTSFHLFTWAPSPTLPQWKRKVHLQNTFGTPAHRILHTTFCIELQPGPDVYFRSIFEPLSSGKTRKEEIVQGGHRWLFFWACQSL